MAFIPPPFKPIKVCDRCGLWYPKKLKNCPHCKGLDEIGLADLKANHKLERNAAENLGGLILYVAALLLVGLIVFGASNL